ncbi:ABC transporter substrate-binding protein [Paenibacillus chondroitinus]|uniref:ABC transporter substrate-binding protein n=1 Tax=Paenibacillus chondroitinus TaxID=59842 RepID=A0ABU6D7Z0_9BACL|nr:MULTISPECIES: ABC transporter substrate-binding protein [Paenibacillus]MCY9661768.1 ABC transporter substrate-binding protein [Paenibacillus anseongense]MEB4793853.1 ABC transporter substrate-binding protein [Paenibacillus chondroitinus]
MFKKKLVSILAVSSVIMLSACGTGSAGDKAASGSANTASSPQGKIVIKYWTANGGKIEEAKQNLVKKFNESQNKIEVQQANQGNYDDLHAKVQAAFAAGNAPAVFDLEIASTGIFARSGMLVDLTPLAARDEAQVNIKDFNPGLMGNAYIDGKLYGIPFMRSTPIFYKNVTMLKDAGLDPAGPKNWKELEEYSRVLKAKGKTPMTMAVGVWEYEALVAQSGGKVLSEDGKKAAFNSPEGVAPVEFWKKMSDDGLIKFTVGKTAGADAEKDWTNQISAFKIGSTAGVSASLEVAKGNNFVMATDFMPANKSYGVPTGGCQLAITSKQNDAEKEATWEFVKFMTSKENTIYQHKYVGYLPNRLSALQSDELQNYYKEFPQYKVASDQLQYAVMRPNANAYAEVSKTIIDAMTKAILEKDVKPQDAMNEAAEKANKLLSK